MRLRNLVEETAHLNIISIVGLPVKVGSRLFNCAVVFKAGEIIAVVPKTHLPNYNEFYEKRWFVSSKDAIVDSVELAGQRVPFGINLLIGKGDFRFAIELCEDLWVTVPPSSLHSIMGAQVIFNLSASNEIISKNDYLLSLISQQSARCMVGYVYVGAGFGESSQDVVFAGKGIVAENGRLVAMANRFSFEEQLLVSEIDIELLANERQKNTGFAQDSTALFPSLPEYRLIECSVPEIEAFTLSAKFLLHLLFLPVWNWINAAKKFSRYKSVAWQNALFTLNLRSQLSAFPEDWIPRLPFWLPSLRLISWRCPEKIL